MSPILRRSLPWLLATLGLLFAAVLLPGKLSVWVDDQGRPVLTNRDGPVEGGVELRPEDLSLRGGEAAGDESVPRSSSAEEDRFRRELIGARDDIRRGELRRGLRELRRLQREHPSRPEPAWLVARVERRRGRLEPALEALDSALFTAAHMPPGWREAAEALRAEIRLELAHARSAPGEDARVAVEESSHFRISYDHGFAGRSYGESVLEMLERARLRLDGQLGAQLGRILDVRLYTRADYLEQYQHRFGFATVGFYDGSIHVVSARHPRDELYALLLHEYAHALFEDALGGHQPFFLNEGIADSEEERARGRERLPRSDWRRLLDASRDGSWIPLRAIVRGFGGLEGKRALLAYLESRAAVEWIEREQPGAIGRWLTRCKAGERWERALEAETGVDVNGLERALLREVRDRFPPDPLAAAPRQLSGAQ
ncbi:MAG: hypothetical protein JRG76_14935 [Deltaproteobacteria bacterium]|nr:hypothetical protein [Deltaproteobacteria bacterium]